ncbi:DUF4349 domain-containing protein [Streptomyces sp. AcH 505]|uniref:DUF4349 domain-containing protein n=1 Tax=Streptomyces sp. AcH 505 TaxID=352211 RepID=UPI0005A82020
MRATPAIAAVLLTASLALAGCSADTDSGSADKAANSAARPREGAPGAAAQADGTPREQQKQQQATARSATYVIRTAELTVQVTDTEKALATARTTAVGAGGLVQNESTERDSTNHVTSTIVLRVPQESYDEVLDELAGTGRLVARSSDAKDVTDQVVDVDSRVSSQRASVARVRELMDRATKLSDVVELEGQLSSRQADLESLLSQQASLKNRTSMATISLNLSQKHAVAAKEKAEDDPGFLDALGGGWDAFTGTLRWIGVVIGAVAPFAVALAVLYLLWRLVRGRLPRRTAPVPAAQPREAAEQE